jgi:hypothetical protein
LLLPDFGYTFVPRRRARRRFLWGAEYSYKLLFYDTDKWNSLTLEDSGLPVFDSPMGFHNFRFFLGSIKKIHCGLIAGFALSEQKKEDGMNKWEGFMAGAFLEARRKLLFNIRGHAGFNFGFGRYKIVSMYHYSGVGISGHTQALFFEPYVGFSYSVTKVLVLKNTFSTFLDVGRNWDLSEGESDESVLPRGLILSFTVGVEFR